MLNYLIENRKISIIACFVITFSHYPIKERFDKNLRKNVLYVDCGDEAPQNLLVLERLSNITRMFLLQSLFQRLFLLIPKF